MADPSPTLTADEREAHFRRQFKAWHRRLIADQASGDLESAQRRIKKAESRYPRRPELHRAIGEFHLGRGEVDHAIAAYEKAVELEPSGSRARIELFEILVALERQGEALEVLEPVAHQV